MDADLAGLWVSAATTLVALMTTDGWGRVKAGFAGLWRRRHPGHVEAVETDLEASRAVVMAARRCGDGLAEAEAELVAEWQGRLRRLAGSDEELQGQIRRLVEDLRPLLSSSAPAGPVVVRARASGRSRIYQAGRDQHFHYGAAVRRVAASGAVDGGSPYPGLASFSAEQAAWFFGRDRLVADLLGRLNECLVAGGPVMLVAPSGAGKSSLLRAGVLPAIADGGLTPAGSRHWPRVIFTPGAHPLRRAAVALLAACPDESGPRIQADPGTGDLDSLLARAAKAAAEENSSWRWPGRG